MCSAHREVPKESLSFHPAEALDTAERERDELRAQLEAARLSMPDASDRPTAEAHDPGRLAPMTWRDEEDGDDD